MTLSPTFKAALWMIGAISSFTLMAIAGRTVSLELDTFEIMMYRSFVGVTVVLFVGFVTGHWRRMQPRRFDLHLIRNIGHFAGQNLWFYAITLIPLAQVFALEFTSPLWVLVLSPLVLGERLTKIRALAALLGFIGVLIVARPSPESLNTGVITAALAAIGFAVAILFTKRLTRTETLISILFWMTVLQSIFGLLCAGYDGDIARPTSDALPWLVLIGCAGLVAHYCLTTALSIAPATVVVPVDFTRLPIIAFVGWSLYGEPIDIFVLLGAIVIFAANYLNIWIETRKSPK